MTQKNNSIGEGKRSLQRTKFNIKQIQLRTEYQFKMYLIEKGKQMKVIQKHKLSI